SWTLSTNDASSRQDCSATGYRSPAVHAATFPVLRQRHQHLWPALRTVISGINVEGGREAELLCVLEERQLRAHD
ncbi:hypothetical protein, partial [Palleronia aestuarii]|uniref:hypothetical protein n=1 Tax=Palleronia aestuarii TaxID=568105 RepID=UPI001B863090